MNRAAQAHAWKNKQQKKKLPRLYHNYTSSNSLDKPGNNSGNNANNHRQKKKVKKEKKKNRGCQLMVGR